MSRLFDDNSVIKENKDYGIEGLFIAHEISKLSPSNLQKFIKSDSCRNLIKVGILEQENIDDIQARSELDKDIVIAALNHAKNKGDGQYEKIINLKKELDDEIGELLKDYIDDAEDTVAKYKEPAINKVKELNSETSEE